MTPLVPVILSGGSGTRLWPLSRAHYPKQLLALHGDQTMLQATLGRVADRSRFAPPLIVANEDHRFIIAEQLRAMGLTPDAIILEPVARNTAPAIALAALRAIAAYPSARLLVLASDHVIGRTQAFDVAVAIAGQAANSGRLVTFGITADRPETGYGYIRMGAPLAGTPGARAVDAFVEKPDRATAERYLASGDYVWNSGMFLFDAADFLAELEAFEPAIVAACRDAIGNAAPPDEWFVRPERHAFASSPSRSVDYAVMEKTSRAACVPADLGWSDVGAWSALWDLAVKNDGGNVTQGDVLTKDVTGSYLRSHGPTIAAVGVDAMVVVATPDAVLVASRDRVQDVKAIVEQLAASGRSEHLHHTVVHRPWGSYEITDAGDRFQTRRLVVKPGHRLALQRHRHRAEHWVVVSGAATVQRGDAHLTIAANESVFIPAGVIHRLANESAEPLWLVEIQSGDLLSDEDIERFAD